MSEDQLTATRLLRTISWIQTRVPCIAERGMASVKIGRAGNVGRTPGT